MSTFYVDDVISLGELLDRASRKAGADLLVPDLQRPYVWTPMQVIRLVDSLFRDWPVWVTPIVGC